MKQTLKKLTAFMLACTLTVATMDAQAQVPQKFNYQGIARDTKGNPMAQQRMTLKLTVLPTADATTGEYEEIQTVTTNEFGLYTLQIGNGTPVNGEMKAVKWETGNKYIKVAIDPKGGSDFVDAGTNQLLSVPYAIYADKAGMAKTTPGGDRAGAVSTSASGTGTVNFLTKFTAANTIYNSQIYDNGTNIGIGTTSPVARVHISTPTAGVTEHFRMQNTSTTGAGRFTLYNSNTNAFATFTKYGTHVSGGYSGVTSLYPYANLLAFGNNDTNGAGNGRFLVVNEGNTGIGIFKGSTKLKFHVDYVSENVGVGGNSVPVSRVHMNNTDGTSMDVRLTNTTSGHTASDGLVIRENGNVASITNRENGSLHLGANNDTNMLSITPTQLLYNATSSPSLSDVIYFKPKNNGGSNWMTLQGTQANSYTFVNMIDSGMGNKGTIFGQSSALYSLTDSAGFIIYNPNNHSTALGTYFAGGLIFNNANGKFGNGYWYSPMSGNAHFNINTSYDTAGNFESSTSNYTGGILRGRYTGTYISDHIAVSGYSNPDPTTDYGIGVRGEGGYYGVQGFSNITGSYNYGVSGSATSNGTSYGLTGYAGYSSTTGGDKYGTYTSAGGGANNYGLYATVNAYDAGNGTGVYALGKQTGVYGQADSASAFQTNWLGTTLSYKEAIGVMGKGNASNTPVSSANVGVAGSAINAGNWFNVGVFGEAANANNISGANYGVFGRAPVAVGNYAGFFVGDVNVIGNLAKSSGTFKIDHPQDPANKYLIHSFVESPDMMNVYNGNAVSDANGFATISLPSYFEAENKDFKYQLTVIDNSTDFVMAKVTKEVSNNTFEVKTSKPNVKVSWQVTGVRQDAYANAHRIVDVVDKDPADKGYYLHPELFGAPSTQMVGLHGNPNTEKHLLPTPEDHKKAMEEKKRVDDEHLQKQQNDQKNWKQQQAPKSEGRMNSSSPGSIR